MKKIFLFISIYIATIGSASSTVQDNILKMTSKGETNVTFSNARFDEHQVCPDSLHPHAIDLGLPSGTKWACCNVGAKTPEDGGRHYAWGETKEKKRYFCDTYAHFDSCSTKKIVNIGEDIAGTPHDVAHVLMGGAWRMPTTEEQNELRMSCTHQNCSLNGISGTLVTGPNGKQIFLPAAGYRWRDEIYEAGKIGIYWSASLELSYEYDAYIFSPNIWKRGSSDRWYGMSVRAVCP